ncbi:MAG TPA: hypothetical protein PLG90_10725 [Ignavibacteria bacterium]|nr:hypothetical protein [Ignavibacteria bacterium]
MRKLFYSLGLLLCFLMFANFANAQISVTVTNPTNTTPNLLVAYPSLDAALTDLNAVNAMTGPVILTLTGGGSEIAPNKGFTIGSATLNPVLSASNTVTITTTGGVVTINAGIGDATPTSASPDGILKIVGADYITINGITFTDGNVTNPQTMEFGVGLFKLNLSDGAQNNTIQNCIFNMQRINNASSTAPMVEGSVGILVINSIPTAATTALVPDIAAGSNSNNRIYSNQINGGNYGIALSGYNAPSPFDRGDTGNDIGGISGMTGNSILNFGGAPAASNPSAGVRANFQWGLNVSYNTINNNNGGGVNHPNTLRGIHGQAGTSANVTINNNTIEIHGGATTSQVAAIENAIGSTALSNTVNINNNNVSGDYLTATSGVFYGIFNSASATNVNINENNVSNMSYSGVALTGTGVNYMIYNTGAAPNLFINSNTVNNISRTGTTGGNLIAIFATSGTTQTVKRNSVTNVSLSGTGISGFVYGIQTAGSTVICDSNIVNNISISKATGTAALYGIYNFGSPTNENFNYNQINNIQHAGTGITYGMYVWTALGTRTVSYNTIHTVSNNGATVAGMHLNSSSPNIFRNKIYNVFSNSATNPTVSGLLIAGGTVVNAYNNIVGDIKAPNSGTGTPTTPVVRGINVTSTTASSSINLTNNSVFLNATSIGANFPTTGLFVTSNATATTAALTLRNNIIINNSTPAGTGFNVAYQRSTTALNNYTSTSDYNLFYAGVPAPSSLIHYNGTTGYQTIGDFKTLVTPREQNSVTENTTFTSLTGSSDDFLRPDSLIASFTESGGITGTGVTIDFRGLARYPDAGYPNNPSFPAFAPDLGAFEFGGIWTDVVGPSITYSMLGNTASVSNRTLATSIIDPSGVAGGANSPRLYYKKSTDMVWQFDATPVNVGDDYTFTINVTALGGVTAGDIIQYYVAAQDLLGNVRTNPLGGSGINPPGTTPPGAPNSYIITAAPLSGEYTVGLSLFSTVTGKNLYSEERIRKVQQQVVVETDNVSSKSTVEKYDSPLNDPNVRTETREVEEKYYVLMENGKEYEGANYYEFTNEDRTRLGLGDNMVGAYTTITDAVADANLRGVASHTTFSLIDNSYLTETFPLNINITAESKTGPSATLTIKPAIGITPAITGSFSSGAMIRIFSDYVIIDGSNLINGSTKDMTISNTSLTSPTVLWVGNLGTDTTNNVIIKNTVLINGINTSSAVVISDGTVLGNPGNFNNILFENNNVQRAYIGLYINASLTVPSFATVTGNDFTSMGASSIRYCGIYMQGIDGGLVSQNQIANFDGTSSEMDRAIWFATGTRNSTIERNFVHSLNYTGTGGYGAYGAILTTGVTGSNNVVKNNSISNLSGDGWTYITLISDNTHGIYLSGTQTGVDIFNNSINLVGNTLNQANALSTGICLATGSTAEIKNNNIVNNLGLLLATGYGSAGIFVQTGASQLESSDYNNIFVNPTGSGVKTTGKVGTTDHLTIQDWRTASSQDANSISWDPQYVGLNNLLPQSNAVNGTGIPIASVTNDILGNPRSTSISNGPSDIGAYEITSGTVTTLVQNITGNGSYVFAFGGKTIGEIIISGFVADAAFDISWMHFSGMMPPTAPMGTQYAASYDSVWVSAGTFDAASYEIRIYAEANNIFNITNPTNIVLAKSNSGGAVWQPSPGLTNGYTPGSPSGYGYATGLTSFSLFAITSSDAPLPVELASFTATANRNSVDLKWATATEVNNSGFELERKTVGTEVWSKIGSVSGAGNSSTLKNYSFSDRNLTTGKYNYRLKQIDFNGNFEYYNLSSEIIVGVPSNFELSQNYPNPFNPSTKINYDLPFDSKVSLKVYDMLGKEVYSVLNSELKTAGYYTSQLNFGSLASGTYFYRIIAIGVNGQEFVTTKKMQLVK